MTSGDSSGVGTSAGGGFEGFPDEAHLRSLRTLLWADAGRGRASVMVGAGMSRNAVPLKPDRGPMPLWSDLAAAMARDVWPTGRVRRDSDALLVAEYYERLHTRPVLDEFLRNQVRDEDFVAGRLHVLLMALPWADVFTTNFDTLLERACQGVMERRYSLVVTQADLSSALHPRIVKLNGSIPSHRPLVITQEDFRRYPAKCAAFVNTVQQAIMETSVCMVGFSGDDPNFQAWTGWVRDNLGQSAPPLFHCGVLDLDVAQRSYYEAHNVRPVDLGPLFPKSEWSGKDRHSAALEWFILSLAEGAPVDRSRWPSRERRKPTLPMTEQLKRVVGRAAVRRRGVEGVRESVDREKMGPASPMAWDATEGLPALLPPEDEDQLPLVGECEAEEALARLNTLQQTYPGWILAPGDTFLEHGIPRWYHSLGGTQYRQRVDVLRALAWALDVMNWPWDDEFIVQVEEALESSEPSRLPSEAVELVCALVREARERDEPDRFDRWMQCLRIVAAGRPPLVALWWLEKAQFHLARLELEEAATALQCVTTQPGRPFLDVLRGRLFFELGRFDEAAAIATNVVDALRRRADPWSQDMGAFGGEASALDLAMAAMSSMDHGLVSVGTGYLRRQELLRSGADPRQFLEERGAALAVAHVPGGAITKDFDPGAYTKRITHQYGNQQLSPYAYLRALEVSGQLPTNHRKHVGLAAARVAVERPAWAFDLLVRAGEDLDVAFSRQNVLALEFGQVVALWRRCAAFLNGLIAARETLLARWDTHLVKNATEHSVELLSRLTVRADGALREEGLNLAIELHECREFRAIWHLHGHLTALFERLLLSMPLGEQADALSRLVGMSIPGAEGERVFGEYWRDPCSSLSGLHGSLRGRRAEVAVHAQGLIRALRVDNDLVKAVAVTRLDALHRAGGLDDGLTREYVEALWSSCGTAGGIPVVRGFSLHMGLLMSAGLPDARDRFVNWALVAPIPPLFVAEEVIGRRFLRSQHHWVARHVDALQRATLFPWTREPESSQLVDWTAEQVLVLLKKVEDWLPSLAALEEADTERWNDREHEVVDAVGDFIASVLLPRLGGSGATSRERLLAIDAKVERLGRHSLQNYPTWLFMERDAGVATLLRAVLSSRSDDDVRSGLRWVFEWLGYSEAGQLPPPPDDIVDHVFLLTALAPGRSQCSALLVAYSVCEAFPATFTERRRGWVQVTLERLFRAEPPPGRMEEVDRAQEMRGDVRAAAARLLTHLSVVEGGEPWTELAAIAEIDEYPEVRRACEETRHRLASAAGR